MNHLRKGIWLPSNIVPIVTVYLCLHSLHLYIPLNTFFVVSLYDSLHLQYGQVGTPPQIALSKYCLHVASSGMVEIMSTKDVNFTIFAIGVIAL